MDGTPHRAIYTGRELAELLAEHDRKYPKHGTDCPCGHGLIRATRTLFGSTVPAAQPVPRVVHEPRPYVSPDVRRGTTRGTGCHGR